MSETVENESASNASPLPGAGHIHNVDFLDLSSAKTPDDLQGITRITNVDCVLIPEHLMTALTRIPMENVDTVIPVLSPSMPAVSVTSLSRSLRSDS